MQTGLHYGVPFSAYQEIDAINKSGLDLIEKSPLHFWSDKIVPRADTPTLKLGRATHAAVLEPEEFRAKYRREPRPEGFPGYLNTAEDYKKACSNFGLAVSGTKAELRKRLEAFQAPVKYFSDVEAACEGFEILTDNQMRACEHMRERAETSETMRELMRDGFSEVTLVWNDTETGVLCKARADRLRTGLFLDLKTAQDASPAGFAKSVVNYKYYRQAAWYVDGYRALHPNEEPPLFVFAVYESEPPFADAYYFADSEMLELGRKENRELLKLYAACRESGVWPGYSPELQPLILPKWKTANQKPEEF